MVELVGKAVGYSDGNTVGRFEGHGVGAVGSWVGNGVGNTVPPTTTKQKNAEKMNVANDVFTRLDTK